MNLTVAYRGRSELRLDGGTQTLSFAPNLTREPVSFDAALEKPLRFREAISALHDVVASDLRFKPRDKTAYQEWKQAQAAESATIRREVFQRTRDDLLKAEVEPELLGEYRKCLHRYWRVRQQYADYLRKNDPALWRMLVPCDPVITVADDVVFFECFSADESSYGCLTVEREAGFGKSDQFLPGTTNVDYSWDLYDHFQSLRSYRPARLRVDPAGFEVASQGSAAYREEKIDLPAGWLRGFMQVQGAMGLPMRRVSLSREAVYSVLAWLKRHRARKSPRAMRFELVAGRPPTLVLEPWEQRIDSFGPAYEGPSTEPIRIWGTRRLLVLARTLPLAERFDVYLLGTGLPSFWLARMGEMRLTVGQSGWTANDWTRGSALDLLAPPGRPSRALVDRTAEFLRRRRAARFDEIRSNTLADPGTCAAALNHLAQAGQVICDLGAGLYRFRQVMPMVVGEAEMGPENEELVASRELVGRGRVAMESRQQAPVGTTLCSGKVDDKPVELLVDADGAVKRGKCVCGHHRRAGIRMGPCRHLLAMRATVLQGQAGPADQSTASWYHRLQARAAN